MEFNDELLTDLATLLFGFGIFNANGSFQFSQNSDRWSYSRLGYLSPMEWGYALALFAFLRQEEKPQWLNHLNKTVQGDFNRAMAFLLANPDKVFQEEPEQAVGGIKSGKM